MRPSLSVVIPTYGNREGLPALVDELVGALRATAWQFEVVIVDDASPDGTWEILRSLAERVPELVALELLTNVGQQRATMCGLAHARGDMVATMDDDLQHPPRELPRLVSQLHEHPDWDVVMGSWPRDQGALRNVGSAVHGFVDRLSHGHGHGLQYSAFRVMRREVVDAILQHGTTAPVLGPLLRQTTRRIHNIPVEHHSRGSGTSTFRLRDGARTVTTNLLQGTTLPLRIMSAFGVMVAALAFAGGCVLLVRGLTGAPSTPGWLSSFLAVLFFGGMTLLTIGLLGQYVHLIIREVKHPPRWSVRSTAGTTHAAAHGSASHPADIEDDLCAP